MAAQLFEYKEPEIHDGLLGRVGRVEAFDQSEEIRVQFSGARRITRCDKIERIRSIEGESLESCGHSLRCEFVNDQISPALISEIQII